MSTLRHVKAFLKKYKYKYIIGIIVLIIIDALQLIIPRLIGNFTDEISENLLTQSAIYTYMFKIIAITLGIAVGRYIWRMLIFGTSKQLEYWLRNRLFGHLEKLSTAYFNTHKTGDLMAHGTNDINAVRMAFGPGIVMLTDAVFMTILTIALMIKNVDLRLTLVAIAPLLLISIFITLLGKVIQKRFKLVQEAFSTLTGKAQEVFSGIRIIKSFTQEDAEYLDFMTTNQLNYEKNMSLIQIWGAVFPLVALISSLSILVSMAYGGILVIDQVITIGQFVTFISYIGILTWPMMAIGYVINVMQRGMVSLNRINTILDTEPEIVDHPDATEVGILEPIIEFNNLSFTYPGTDAKVLDDISFKVEPGETLAILGRTGCGKTTLVNLLLRLYNVNDGEIFIGGIDINALKLSQLRNMIGCVPQDNYLFSTTVKDNISFFSKVDDEEEIQDFAKISNLHQEIMGFDHGYDTLLGERGVNMSGGQKQRLSISRALIKKPSILIFDDSLSAVDTKTEEKILDNLKNIMKGKTSIIISHRVSTIMNSDKILVLDEGKIVEFGNHESLIQMDGFYSELYGMQLLSEQIENK